MVERNLHSPGTFRSQVKGEAGGSSPQLGLLDFRFPRKQTSPLLAHFGVRSKERVRVSVAANPRAPGSGLRSESFAFANHIRLP